MDAPQENSVSFLKELEQLINRHSKENESDTPDYILAEYVAGCLTNYARTVKHRDAWFQFKPWDSVLTKRCCNWNWNGDGFYETDCGKQFYFNDSSTPKENDFTACPFCALALRHDGNNE
jgi:hypothetical protein